MSHCCAARSLEAETERVLSSVPTARDEPAEARVPGRPGERATDRSQEASTREEARTPRQPSTPMIVPSTNDTTVSTACTTK